MKHPRTLIIFDNAEKTFVGFTWKTGAKFMARKDDLVLAVNSWDDCLKQLDNLFMGGQKFDVIQFWGHGSPGNVYVAGKDDPYEFWIALASLVKSKESIVWLRVCSFFATKHGKREGNEIAAILKCKLMAHTYSIGHLASQSGTRMIDKNNPPLWSNTEGIKGSKFKDSAPWAPHTVSALENDPPKWATNE